MTTMVLSFWQPWASLIVYGHKFIETRSRAIRFRGRVIVHAAKTWNQDLARLCYTEPFRSTLRACGMTTIGDIPRGCVLGTVDITGCRATSLGVFTPDWVRQLSEKERHFGDFRPGRFGITLDNARHLTIPFDWKGQQGLKPAPDELVRRVDEAFRKEPSRG